MGKQDRQQNQTTKEDRGSPVKDDRTSPKEVRAGQTHDGPQSKEDRLSKAEDRAAAGDGVVCEESFLPDDSSMGGSRFRREIAVSLTVILFLLALLGAVVVRRFWQSPSQAALSASAEDEKSGARTGEKEAPPTNPLKMASETTELHAQEGMAKHKPVAASDPWGPRPPSAAIGLSGAASPSRGTGTYVSKWDKPEESKQANSANVDFGWGQSPVDRGSRSPGASRGQKGEAARNDRPSDPFASPVGSTLAVPSYDQSTSAHPFDNPLRGPELLEPKAAHGSNMSAKAATAGSPPLLGPGMLPTAPATAPQGTVPDSEFTRRDSNTNRIRGQSSTSDDNVKTDVLLRTYEENSLKEKPSPSSGQAARHAIQPRADFPLSEVASPAATSNREKMEPDASCWRDSPGSTQRVAEPVPICSQARVPSGLALDGHASVLNSSATRDAASPSLTSDRTLANGTPDGLSRASGNMPAIATVSSSGRLYQVQDGDTLAGIAKRELGKARAGLRFTN